MLGQSKEEEIIHGTVLTYVLNKDTVDLFNENGPDQEDMTMVYKPPHFTLRVGFLILLFFSFFSLPYFSILSSGDPVDCCLFYLVEYLHWMPSIFAKYVNLFKVAQQEASKRNRRKNTSRQADKQTSRQADKRLSNQHTLNFIYILVVIGRVGLSIFIGRPIHEFYTYMLGFSLLWAFLIAGHWLYQTFTANQLSQNLKNQLMMVNPPQTFFALEWESCNKIPHRQ